MVKPKWYQVYSVSYVSYLVHSSINFQNPFSVYLASFSLLLKLHLILHHTVLLSKISTLLTLRLFCTTHRNAALSIHVVCHQQTPLYKGLSREPIIVL